MPVDTLAREGALYFKSCPKCSGDLQLQHDSFGPYLDCLQCGYNQDLDLSPLIPNSSEPQYRSRLNVPEKIS